MSTPTAELLALSPCPGCNADDCRVIGGPGTAGGPQYWAGCMLCRWRTWGDTEAQAIEAWNTRARPSLSAQAVGDAWQPIESAPKDGTEILLWGTDEKAVVGEWLKCASPYWLTGLFGDHDSVYTHWQPLPPAPGTTPPQPADGGDRVGELVEAMSEVVRATRAYLPPDGIDAAELISRVIAATDNPKINAAMGEIL